MQSLNIEDDTLREGMQSIVGRQLDMKAIKELVILSDEIGCEHIMVGFPPSSTYEAEKVEFILKTIKSLRLKVKPWILSRTNLEDVKICMSVAKHYPNTGLAVYRSLGKYRTMAEGWTESQIFKEFEGLFDLSKSFAGPLSVNIEDATRASEKCLNNFYSFLSQYSVESVALCDSVGVGRPRGVAQLVNDCRKAISKDVRIIWHGHNDLGLALANSFAAAEAGASTISGTFLGIGERSGNAPLEQVCMLLNLDHNRNYNFTAIKAYCSLIQQLLNVSVPTWAPIVGTHAFSTQAGTHAAAIYKARNKDMRESEKTFAPFNPSIIGRVNEFYLGPQSGKKMVESFLNEIDKNEYSEKDVFDLYCICKEREVVMSFEEVKAWYHSRKSNEKY